jgi:Emfourin
VGRTSLVELDTRRLTAGQEKELRELVLSSGFFDLPAELPGGGLGADRFRYRLTVQSKGETRTVEMDESAVPNSVRPLLEWISRSPRNR